MPVALIIALAASLGLHAAALFGPEFDLATDPEPVMIAAELRPLPLPLPPPQPPVEVAAKPDPPARAKKPARPRTPRRQVETAANAAPVPAQSEEAPPAQAGETLPAAAPDAAPEAENRVAEPVAEPVAAPAAPRLPAHGLIRYRVDRGDSNFEIGYAQHEWEIADGRYLLHSVVETTGLVRLFKSLRIEMESRGTLSEEGLRPESFVIRRNGEETLEWASFD